MITLDSASRFEELLVPDVASSSYDYTTIFKTGGFFVRRRSQAKFKLLRQLDARLQAMLAPGERVFFVTTGVEQSFVESFFLGWAAYYLNRRAFIFTTERILLVQIDARSRPQELEAQLSYAAVTTVKSSWTGSFRVAFRNGKKKVFSQMPRADRVYVRDWLHQLTQGLALPPNAPGNLENLCPHCHRAVAGFPATCPHCAGGFKSAAVAAIRSGIFPGLGDYYLGHRGFAVMEMLGTAFLWLGLVVAPLIASGEPELAEAKCDGSYWIGVAIILSAAHAVDAAVTHHIARKGLYPAYLPHSKV